MSRPKKGYTISRKIKDAKKCLTHASATKNKDRKEFWEKYVDEKSLLLKK
jgi:hypothetical protein